MRRLDTRECSSCHDRSSLTTSMRDDPMYEGADFSGLKNIQSSAMSWDYLKRLRDLTKLKMVIKGILAWEDAKIAAETGIDAIIVSNHGGRADESGRSTIESLPEIIAVSGTMPVLIDFGSAVAPTSSRRCAWAPRASPSVGPICGVSAPSASLASSACSYPAHRADGRHAANRRAVAQGPQAVYGAAVGVTI